MSIYKIIGDTWHQQENASMSFNHQVQFYTLPTGKNE
jgi:hypothetical protein